MDVWITWAKKRSMCKHCGEYILSGTPVVKGKLWRKVTGELIHFTLMFRWHPQCWVEQGIAALPEYHGSYRLPISEEQRKRRFYLLRRWATLQQRVKAASMYPQTKQALIGRLTAQMEEIKEEMLGLGGIPKKWV